MSRWKQLAAIAVTTLFVSTQPVASVPQATLKNPYDLRAKTRFDGGIAVAVLAWRDQSDGELGFEVYRSDNGGKFKVVGIVGANTTGHEDKIGKYITGSFQYQIKAFNDGGKSDPSNTVGVWF